MGALDRMDPDSPDPEHGMTTLNERRAKLGYPPIKSWYDRPKRPPQWLTLIVFLVICFDVILGGVDLLVWRWHP